MGKVDVIPAHIAIMLTASAIREGTQWRPVAMFGRYVTIQWDELQTSREKAIEWARPLVAEMVQKGMKRA